MPLLSLFSLFQKNLAGTKWLCEVGFRTSFDCPVTISTKDKRRLHQFGTRVLPGKFIGYVLYSGGGGET